MNKRHQSRLHRWHTPTEPRRKISPHPVMEHTAGVVSVLERFRRLKTKEVFTSGDIKRFFDACAPTYAQEHGDVQRLLHYRTALIKEVVRPENNHVVLDVGCGIGHHLLALAKDIGHGIGIDFSEKMIALAKRLTHDSPWRGRLTFHLDDAEELSTIPDASIDIIICIGALEHMPRKHAVLSSGYRVLKPGGRFLCLTPNGENLWYRFLAPLLRVDTKHLSTDTFLTGRDMEQLLAGSGYDQISFEYWTFIPKGDIHWMVSATLQVLDTVGTLLHMGSLRGGLFITGRKPRGKDW